MPEQETPPSRDAAPAAPQTCPVTMHNGNPCGRPIHPAPAGVDKIPVCLMHSRDPQKSDEEFQREFERILAAAGEGVADFTRFVFPTADYSGKSFKAHCIFHGATFAQADFREATFAQNAAFSGATFAQNAYFSRATFAQADFSGATFAQNAAFTWATFAQADFFGATFEKTAYFVEACFGEPLDFSNLHAGKDSEILLQRVNRDATRRVSDRDAAKTQNLLGRPAKDWPQRTIEIPGLLLRLRNTLLDQFRFEDVRWHKEEERIVLQDELDLRAHRRGLTHELVAQSYRRLVINFEKHRQYELAEECVVGEMEMRRRDPDRFIFEPGGKATYYPWTTSYETWLGERLSFLWLYKALSLYGTSYWCALVVLGLLLLIFLPLLYGWAGLSLRESDSIQVAQRGPVVQLSESVFVEHAAPKVRLEHAGKEISWSRAWTTGDKEGGRSAALLGAVRETVLFSLEVATFQRERLYEPSSGWGRFLVVLETIAVPGQLTLFLLALRRRFRR